MSCHHKVKYAFVEHSGKKIDKLQSAHCRRGGSAATRHHSSLIRAYSSSRRERVKSVINSKNPKNWLAGGLSVFHPQGVVASRIRSSTNSPIRPAITDTSSIKLHQENPNDTRKTARKPIMISFTTFTRCAKIYIICPEIGMRQV